MLKVLKIRSVENATYTPQYNRMRFKIPADNLNTHLDESYLSFDVNLIDTATKEKISSASNLGFGNDNKVYYPTCLFKNVRLFRGDSNIPLEEIQHFNILDQTLKMYEKDFEDMISDQLEKGFIVKDTFQGEYSPFFQVATDPTVPGVLSINIPLKYIFGLCKNKDFYLSETGGLQIEFELEDKYKLFNEEPVANPVNAVVASALDIDNDLVSGTSVSTIIPAYTASSATKQSKTWVSPSSGAEYLVADELFNGNVVEITSTDGASKDTGTAYVAELKQQFRTLHSDNVQTSYWGTYDTDKKVWPLTLPLENSITYAKKPSDYIYNGITYDFEPDVINSVAKNSLLSATTIGRFTPLKIYYKESQSTNVWKSIDGRFVSSTGYVAGAPPTKATITMEIASTDSVNKPLPATAYHMMIELCDAIPSQTNDSKHSDLADNATTGSTPIPMEVGKHCYNLVGLTLMADSCTNIVFTNLTDTTPATIQFTSGLSDDFDPTNNAEYDMILTPLFEVLDPRINPTYQAVSDTQEYHLSNRTFETYGDGVDDITITLVATSTDTLTVYDKVNNKPLLGNDYNAILLTGLTRIPSYGSIRFVNLTTENQVEGYGAVPKENISYEIPRAELVLIQSAKQSSDNVSSVYTTWKMEPALIDYKTARWQRQFILEPGVFNACLVMPEQISSGSELMISETDKVNSYRWSLDNIDNTNRDVLIKGGLHNDKLIDWFKNSSYDLKSLSCYDNRSAYGVIPMKIYTAMDNENMYMDNKNHTLQVVLNSLTNLETKNIYLFKQLLKNL